MFRALQRARGFNGAINDDDARTTGDIWSAALKRIPADRLRAAFETALGKYADPSVPFGAPQILEAWQEMTGGTGRPVDPILAEKPKGFGCTNGDGHDYRPDGVEIAGWRYLACAHCGRRAVEETGR